MAQRGCDESGLLRGVALGKPGGRGRGSGAPGISCAARLAACVNMFPGMISIFEWKGAREEANEVAMIIKTRGSLTEAVLKETKRLHPYELPALLVLPTQGGSAEYCGWIASQTGGSAR